MDNIKFDLLMVIIPAFNEEKTIADVIANVPKQIDNIKNIEVLVIDDGSTDTTAAEAKAAGASVLTHKSNRGLGIAIGNGLKQAINKGADVVVNIDADGQFNPEHIRHLVAPVLSDEADMVTASRFKEPSLIPTMPRVKLMGNRLMSRLISKIVKKEYSDVSCGFRAYSKEALINLNLMGKFTYTQEMFLELSFKGLRIIEIPLEVRGVREDGRSKIASNLWVYGLRTFEIIFNSVRDYQPIRFFSIVALLLLIMSFGFGGFFLLHYITVGSFSPHIWSAFVSGFFFFMSILVTIFGQLAAMFIRQRNLSEEILVLLRKQKWEEACKNRYNCKGDME